MAKTKVKLTPAERMLATKRKLVKRLRDEQAWVRQQAADRVAKIEKQIRIAQALIDALERGTLVP